MNPEKIRPKYNDEQQPKILANFKHFIGKMTLLAADDTPGLMTEKTKKSAKHASKLNDAKERMALIDAFESQEGVASTNNDEPIDNVLSRIHQLHLRHEEDKKNGRDTLTDDEKQLVELFHGPNKAL